MFWAEHASEVVFTKNLGYPTFTNVRQSLLLEHPVSNINTESIYSTIEPELQDIFKVAANF